MSLTDASEERMLKGGPFNEGFDAYWDGVMYEQNPYQMNSIEYQRWADGWISAEERDCTEDGR